MVAPAKYRYAGDHPGLVAWKKSLRGQSIKPIVGLCTSCALRGRRVRSIVVFGGGSHHVICLGREISVCLGLWVPPKESAS